jgi:hypothetical protein
MSKHFVFPKCGVSDPKFGRVDENGRPISPSGMKLTKSVSNPKSRLFKTVLYLRWMGSPVSRREIVEKCWKKKYLDRGYGAEFFSLAVRTGFLKNVRRGRKWFLVLGDNPQVDFIC